jgi:hypothetical protein
MVSNRDAKASDHVQNQRRDHEVDGRCREKNSVCGKRMKNQHCRNDLGTRG